MRAVLDTNILVSALLVPAGFAGEIYRAWHEGSFTLLTCEEQVEELRDTLHKPRIAALIKPHRAGRLVNELRELAELIKSLPPVRRSPDPEDDFLLGLCEAGRSDYLVTGDKSGLLGLRVHGNTKIVSARDFVKVL